MKTIPKRLAEIEKSMLEISELTYKASNAINPIAAANIAKQILAKQADVNVDMLHLVGALHNAST